MRDQILQPLQQRPFQPIRLHLSNGVVHVVRHPEQVMVSPTFIYIGVPATDAPGPAISEGFIVSLPHVVLLEPLVPATPTGSN
jgi:hypothetical protein